MTLGIRDEIVKQDDRFPAEFLVAVLSDAGLRRSETSSLTSGDVQRWDDGSGRITVIRSKTDVEAQGRHRRHHSRRHGGAFSHAGRRAPGPAG